MQETPLFDNYCDFLLSAASLDDTSINLKQRCIENLIILINTSKIFIIDENLKQFLLNNKNKKFERNLPFKNTWLECKIEINGFVINGVVLYKTKLNEIGVVGTTQINKKEEVQLLIPLNNDNGKTSLLKYPVENLREYDYCKMFDEIAPTLRNFIYNFLDILNHPEVETKITKWPSNEARIKRGKLPIADKVNINVTGKLYRYLYEDLPKMQREGCRYSFWVRTHFVHYRNKDHFKGIYALSLDELKKKGYQEDSNGLRSRLILNYVKGKGILINKVYKVS